MRRRLVTTPTRGLQACTGPPRPRTGPPAPLLRLSHSPLSRPRLCTHKGRERTSSSQVPSTAEAQGRLLDRTRGGQATDLHTALGLNATGHEAGGDGTLLLGCRGSQNTRACVLSRQVMCGTDSFHPP